MRFLAIAVVVSAALLASRAGDASAPLLPIVPCGVVSVPPAYLPQVVSSGQAPMRWWRKGGMIVRSGSPSVTLTVPYVLHNELQIDWGNSNRQGSALRFAAARPTDTQFGTPTLAGSCSGIDRRV